MKIKKVKKQDLDDFFGKPKKKPHICHPKK